MSTLRNKWLIGVLVAFTAAAGMAFWDAQRRFASDCEYMLTAWQHRVEAATAERVAETGAVAAEDVIFAYDRDTPPLSREWGVAFADELEGGALSIRQLRRRRWGLLLAPPSAQPQWLSLVELTVERKLFATERSVNLYLPEDCDQGLQRDLIELWAREGVEARVISTQPNP